MRSAPLRVRERTAAGAGAILALVLLVASPAEGRMVTVRWRWPNPEPGRQIAGFKLYTRHVDQPYGKGVDVGLPPQKDGIYSVSIEVSDTDATYVSATAYDAEGRESPRSNEKLFLLPGPEPPGDRPPTR